jgi:[protein-PII] uridylyltransferase
MSKLYLDPAEFRNRIRNGRSKLQEQFFLHQDPGALLRDHAALIDSVLQSIWQVSAFPDSLALVAVGGYGRCEQYPHSDVDLLILLESAPNAQLAGQLEALIGLLWDIGLDVGHSVRTLNECLEESARDVTVQTNLLEMRFLIGNAGRFEGLKSALFSQFGNGAFFQAKILEQQQRHARFNDTAYNLEPNIKENPGGLRDLQTVIWLSQSLSLGYSWKQLADQGLITQQEARQVRRHEKFLQHLRISLHYQAKRREDRLLFDFQEKMAQGLGIAAGKNRSASEMLMQRYFRTAKAINLMNEILLLNLRSRLVQDKPPPPPLPLNERFQIRSDLLDACDENVFQSHPSSILECFLLLQKHRNLRGFCAPTLRSLWRALPLVDAAFRQDDANRRLFLDIMRESNGLTLVLRRMNQYGILGRYIPAFGKIVGQMQHDLFHVYTVDEHTLMVVRNLRRYTVPEFFHEFPLCSSLMVSFEKPELLYLAGLFHDIAKGRGGDHSRLGRADAKRFCQAHGLLPEETELIVWLVESHLNMSAVAQKQDISDPDVIAAFANTVRDKRHLTALYLLTVSDIRGTSPKVWNAWKGRLLESLYHAACRYLCGVSSTGEQLQARQAEALGLLRQQAVPERPAQLFWDKLDAAYFLRHDAQEIAWHTRVLYRTGEGVAPEKTSAGVAPVVAARVVPGTASGGEGLQVMIYTPDRDDLFARICGFFEQVNFNIVEAKIHTTRQGYALDSFVVLDEEQRASHYRDMLNYIEFELGKQLLDTPPLQAPLRGRISRHLKHFPIAPQVSIRPDDKGSFHVLSVTAGDRPGLLSGISRVFLAHGIHLHTAKINTLGERAEDTFLVSGSALSKNNEIIMLETELIKQLQP